MKRVFLFLMVNILVVGTISIVLSILGVQPYLTSAGINYSSLMAFCLVWGFGGAFISLAISRMMAKWTMGVKVLDPNSQEPTERWLLDTVTQMARAAGLPKTPEVGIYESPDLNAFATGPTRSRALVAVSTGLLQRMNRQQVEGVIGHEVAHVANGDMVTMTLIQGVVNAFVMFLARVIAFALQQAMRSNDDDRRSGGFMYSITVFVLEMVFMVLGTIVVAWFSRQREFRADAGGARLAGREAMTDALRALGANSRLPSEGSPAMAALKISSEGGSSWKAWFSTHPPLEERIARLQMRG